MNIFESVGDLLGVGIVVWVLLLMSVTALSVILMKLWQFVRSKPETMNSIETSLARWRNGDHSDAVSAVEEKDFASEVVLFVMRELLAGRVDLEVIKEEAERLAIAKLNDLRAMLPALESIGTLSPLLGLLGTVLGMIDAFQAMEAAGMQADPSVLSGGIWQALITTAMGLGVAIPSMIAYIWFDRKVHRVATKIDDTMTQTIAYWHLSQSDSTKETT